MDDNNIEKLYINYNKCIFKDDEIIVTVDCYRDIEMENLEKEMIKKMGCRAFWF